MSLNPQGQEIKLFEYHLDPVSYYPSVTTTMPISESALAQQDQQSFSYYSDALTNTSHYEEDRGYSSPQLTHKPNPNFQRKRCKTVNDSTPGNYLGVAAFTLNTKKEEGMTTESPIKNEEDDDDDEDDDDMSDRDSSSPSKRRGKYKVYSDEEKATIIAYMKVHGIQSTLEHFSDQNNKITKRKLKSWLDSQHKVKGVKGRKTNDPNRDQALHEWCTAFQKENGRSPTRKEATKRALELSGDPSFQASKGWLDKFSRKYMVEFTPLKIVPGKSKNMDDGNSMMDNSDASSVEAISPLMRAIKAAQPQQQGTDQFIKPISLDKSNSYGNFEQKMNSYMDFTSKAMEVDNLTPLDLMQGQYQQQPYYNNINYEYGLQNNYHLNYQGNFAQPEDNFKMGYAAHNQTYPEVGNFFNNNIKYESDAYGNNDYMRFDGHHF